MSDLPTSELNRSGHDHYDDLLLRSLTEPLPTAARADLDRHLATCSRCREVLAEWQDIAAAVQITSEKQAFSLPALHIHRNAGKDRSLMFIRPVHWVAVAASLILTLLMISSGSTPFSQAQPTAQPTIPPTVEHIFPSAVGVLPTPTPTLIPAFAGAGSVVTHVVREGDTLLSILMGSPFNYSVDQLDDVYLQIIRLNPAITQLGELPAVGHTIVIPANLGPVSGPTPSATSANAADAADPSTFIAVTVPPDLIAAVGSIEQGATVDVSITLLNTGSTDPAAASSQRVVPVVQGAIVVYVDALGVILAVPMPTVDILTWLIDVQAPITLTVTS